jgi:hypothetical protein
MRPLTDMPNARSWPAAVRKNPGRPRLFAILPLAILPLAALPLAALALAAGLAAAPAAAATSGTFSATGSMSNPQTGATATLLATGKVLVAGAGSGPGAPASAELYSPATGTWAVTGAMNNPRVGHTATLLPSGQVLVAGGSGTGSFPLASAELYNPATGTWAYTGSMTGPRDSQAATLLPNGDVLVAAGLITGPFAEAYNPATGQWSSASGGLAPCSYGHYCRLDSTAALLGTGNVLLTGGLAGIYSNPSATATALLYNPATNTWASTGSMLTARASQTETVLPGGQVLVAGGEGFANHKATQLSSAELYTT